MGNLLYFPHVQEQRQHAPERAKVAFTAEDEAELVRSIMEGVQPFLDVLEHCKN